MYDIEVADNHNYFANGILVSNCHEAGDSKRFARVPEADGSYSFEQRLTKGGDRVKRSVAMTAASRQSSIQCRIATTATSLDDGKPRRLWAPLDLADPWGLGGYWDFADAHCGVTTSKLGHKDDSGRSRMDELRQRTAYTIHEATYEETSVGMPKTTLEVTWLPVEQQDNVAGFTAEMNVLASRLNIGTEEWLDAMEAANSGQKTKLPKTLQKLFDDDFEMHSPAGLFMELQIAEACARKRTYVVNRAVDELVAGGKVMVFTTRRRQTEIWAEMIRREVAKRRKGDMAYRGLEPLLLWAHGGTSEKERWDSLDQYKASGERPACFTTTAQAMGTSLDGMQVTSRMVVATLPAKIGLFQQLRGRADRYEGVGTVIELVFGRKTYDERRVRAFGEKVDGVQSLLRADDLDGLALKILGLPEIAEAADRVTEMLLRNMGLEVSG